MRKSRCQIVKWGQYVGRQQYVPQGRYPAGLCRHFQTSGGKVFPPYARHLIAVKAHVASQQAAWWWVNNPARD